MNKNWLWSLVSTDCCSPLIFQSSSRESHSSASRWTRNRSFGVSKALNPTSLKPHVTRGGRSGSGSQTTQRRCLFLLLWESTPLGPCLLPCVHLFLFVSPHPNAATKKKTVNVEQFSMLFCLLKQAWSQSATLRTRKTERKLALCNWKPETEHVWSRIMFWFAQECTDVNRDIV